MSDRAKGRLMMGGAIAAVAAIAVVGVGVATRVGSQQRLESWTVGQAVPVVTVIHAKPSEATGALTLPASLQALDEAPIYARTTGYVRRWFVDIGDPVHKGQVLAILDAPDVDQQLAAARADLETAKANQQLASTTSARWASLLAKDAVSRQGAEEKAGDLAAKTAIVNAARANVARLETLAGFTRLVAPFDGVVTRRTAQVGALVVAGNASAAPLFTIADVSRIRAYVRVPQLYVGQVHAGMVAPLALPEYAGHEFPATMTRASGAVEPGSGTLLVELQAANSDGALKPGSYAQARLPLHGASAGVSLPPSALIIGEHGTQVALLGANGKAVLRPVTLGRDQGKTVEITAGLTLADAVIDNPPESLQAGDAVRTAGTRQNAG